MSWLLKINPSSTGFEKHLVCYQAGRTEALVLTVDAARGAATEAARLEVVSPAALQRGCCPLLLMMPGGSLVAFHYAAMDMTEVAKYYNTTLEFGTLRVFDVRKGKRVKQVDKGILSGISECLLSDSSGAVAIFWPLRLCVRLSLLSPK